MNREELEKELKDYPVSLTITQLGEIIGLERQSVFALLERCIIESYVINPEAKKKHYRVLKTHVIDHILKNSKET